MGLIIIAKIDCIFEYLRGWIMFFLVIDKVSSFFLLFSFFSPYWWCCNFAFIGYRRLEFLRIFGVVLGTRLEKIWKRHLLGYTKEVS